MNKLTITPLGTVSPYCKKNMNCPGFLVKYKDQNILLDCGNGITSLLNFPYDLKNLHIFITHYHKDHYGDLSSLQYASYVYHNLNLLKNPIKIYLPEENLNSSKEEITKTVESFAKYYDINTDKHYQINDLYISFNNNKSHSITSYIITIKIKNLKIVYTSDIGTENFSDLIKICKEANLLICESSFLEKHKSNSKTHFKAKDASKLAKLANVEKLLLTHFWPEEDKTLYLEEAKQNFKNTFVAKENESIEMEIN